MYFNISNGTEPVDREDVKPTKANSRVIHPLRHFQSTQSKGNSEVRVWNVDQVNSDRCGRVRPILKLSRRHIAGLVHIDERKVRGFNRGRSYHQLAVAIVRQNGVEIIRHLRDYSQRARTSQVHRVETNGHPPSGVPKITWSLGSPLAAARKAHEMSATAQRVSRFFEYFIFDNLVFIGAEYCKPILRNSCRPHQKDSIVSRVAIRNTPPDSDR